MSVQRFVVLVVVLAAAIVGLVALVRDGKDPAHLGDRDAEQAPAHHFISAESETHRFIECPVAELPSHTRFWETPIPRCRLVEGWTSPQRWGSWATGWVSVLEIDLERTADLELELRLRDNEVNPTRPRQTVTVSVNGTELGTEKVPRRWSRVRLPIPERVLEIGSNRIELDFRHGTSTLEAGVGTGRQRLAAQIKGVAVTPSAGWSRSGHRRATRVGIWDPDRESFVITEPGTLLLPLLVPSSCARIELDLASGEPGDEPAEVTVALEDLTGAGTASAELTARVGATAAVPAAEVAGRWVVASVEVERLPGPMEVAMPRFVEPAAPPVADAAETVSHARPEGPPPDIVIITLDAARPDRLSCYGHDRRTTPAIDRIAAGSLVFSSAYAETPYTLASVPSMITGLSFLDHQVVDHEDVLSPEATTLAEVLRTAGYYTAAFSATPNNSRSKGFDQGYEVFREVWNELPRRRSRRASEVAALVVEWLDGIASDPRPLHLQIHMVPPHAPYDPPPAHDLFTDPAYDGPCAGDRKTVARLDGGFIDPDPPCIEHMLALYDGNLRAADAAVGRIVETLRRRPTWDNTVILITSDHGEAFMEHGRLGHNTTVYGEMLHVPFVLRLPVGMEAPAVDTDQLVSLTDIAPTLAGLAGAGPLITPDGVDLLDPPPGSERRFIITRTATSPMQRGIRTSRWSMMLTSAGAGGLFDIAADPGESNDLRNRDPARSIGLGTVIETRFSAPPRISPSAATADITAEERELLEVLGYIRD